MISANIFLCEVLEAYARNSRGFDMHAHRSGYMFIFLQSRPEVVFVAQQALVYRAERVVFGFRVRLVYLVYPCGGQAGGVQTYFSVHDILCDNGRVLYFFRALLFPPQKPNRRAYIHHGRACYGVRALRALPDQGLQNGAGVFAYFHF